MARWQDGASAITSNSADQAQADDGIPDLVASTDEAVPSLQPAAAPSQATQPDPSGQVTVTTDVLKVQIALLGGDLVKAALPAYPASLEAPDIPFVLMDPRNGYEAESGLIGPNGTDARGTRPKYQADRLSYALSEGEDKLTVPLRLRQEDGTEIVKKYIFTRGNYLVRVAHEITNRGRKRLGRRAFCAASPR